MRSILIDTTDAAELPVNSDSLRCSAMIEISLQLNFIIIEQSPFDFLFANG